MHSRIRLLAAAAAVLLALLAEAPVAAGQAGGDGERPGYRLTSLWEWTGSGPGVVVDVAVDLGEGVAYALLARGGGAAVYGFSLESGRVVSRVDLGFEAEYGHIYLEPAGISLVLVGRGGNVTALRVNPLTGEYQVTCRLTPSGALTRILDAVKAQGVIVVVGARAQLNGSLDPYIAAYSCSSHRMLWSDAIHMGSRSYFITATATGDGAVCAAGPGGLACYDLNGSRILYSSVNGTILAVDAPSTGSIIASGVTPDGRGFILLGKVFKGEFEERMTGLDRITPSALRYTGGLIYAAGEAVWEENSTVRHNLAVILLDSEGDIEVVGVKSVNGAFVAASLAVTPSGLVLVGSRVGSTPFMACIKLEQAPLEQGNHAQAGTAGSNATSTQAGGEESLGRAMALYYASIASLVAASLLLAYTTLKLVKARRK
ncbi:hypothetical protein JCM10135_02190 [Stetteria hydrogenophila]